MSAKKAAPAKKAAKKAPKGKGGRPKADIDERLVETLASIGCTVPEIAAACNCSVDTLDRRFADVMAKGRENGKTRLRKKQIEVALAGNVSMLIWLGKQILGQAEKVEAKTHHSGSVVTGTLTKEEEDAVKEWARNIQVNIRRQRTRTTRN